jgi:aldehyde dehydrogenase (NAD+)
MAYASIRDIVNTQRSFFESGKTKDVTFRIGQLRKLFQVIHKNEKILLDAFAADMKKPRLEGYASEIAITLNEIRYAINKLATWSRPKMVMTARAILPSICYITREPLGVVLILAPWNYPFQLAVGPLVGAIAAGNCAVVKPSEIAPATSDIIERIFREHFDPSYTSVVTGGPDTAQALLE